jgi:hypothetical protein
LPVAQDTPRHRLVHIGRGRLRLDAGGVKALEQLLGREPVLLGYLVNALGHLHLSLGGRPACRLRVDLGLGHTVGLRLSIAL